MNPIDRCFARLADSGRKALMPYLTAGYPAIDSLRGLVAAAVDGGADIIEVGIPFSDPVADGPVIQGTSQRAIENGMTPTLALQQLSSLPKDDRAPPIVVMTYTNVLMSLGYARFAAMAVEAGVSGVIVPDMPVEASDELRVHLAAAGVHMIFMVTPNLSDARLQRISSQASGFLYLVSVLGTTGERSGTADIAEFVARVKKHTDLPLAVGFGVGTPEQARHFWGMVDGVIIGSALARRLDDADQAQKEAQQYLATFNDRAVSHAAC